MKTRTKVGLIIMAGILAMLGVAVYIYYFTASYPDFDAVAVKDFKIPGLETKFVPQGIDYDQNTGKFLVSGYMSDDSASRFYIIDKETKKVEKYFTLTLDGKAYKGHASGVAINGEYAYVASEGKVYRFNFTDALALTGTKLRILDYFETDNGADFILIYKSKLIVGEFHNGKKYVAPKDHEVKTETGTNHALALIYNLVPESPHGIESTTPNFALSLPNKAQGMSFTKENKIIISTSYSISDSKLLIYENVLETETTSTITLNETTIPVYVLSKANKVKTITAPAMSEELVLVDNKVYLLFESNCAKHRYYNRTRLKNVYALDI